MNAFKFGNLIVCGITVSLLAACGDDAKKAGDADVAVDTDAAVETTEEVAVDSAVEVEDVAADIADTADSADIAVDTSVTDSVDTADVGDGETDSAETTPPTGRLRFIDVGTPVELSSDGDIALLQDFSTDPLEVYFYSVIAGRLDKKTTIGSPLENFATGLSDGGRISGLYSSPVVAGVWSEETGWLTIASPYETGCDNNRGGAWDVSADGKVVVGSFWNGCTTEGFRWTDASGAGVTSPLQILGTSNSEARGPVNRPTVVSDDGRIAAGFAENAPLDRSPAIWNADGSGFLLNPDERDAPGEVLTISPDGKMVAGTSGQVGFYWTQAQGMVFIGVPPEGIAGDPTYVNAIAADGALLFGVTGSPFFGTPQAFVWTEAAGARLLSNILAANNVTLPEGYLLSGVFGASKDGSVVLGGAYDALGAPKSFVLELPVTAYGIE